MLGFCEAKSLIVWEMLLDRLVPFLICFCPCCFGGPIYLGKLFRLGNL